MPDAPPGPFGSETLGLPPVGGAGPALYVSGEDALQLVVLNAAANVIVRLSGLFLPVNTARVRPFTLDLVPTSDRVASSRERPRGEGWVLRALVFAASGTPLVGQTWARLEVVRGPSAAGQVYAGLIAGYVTPQKDLVWPGGWWESPLEGPGALRSITGTTPGAGLDLTETVPTGARWQLVSLRLGFVTSAVVATRVVTVVIDDGALTLARLSASASQAASISASYTVGPGLAAGFSATDNAHSVQLPVYLQLGAGYRIKTAVRALDAGDTLVNIQYLVREWIAGE
jgi:hypothetical protein